MESTWTWMITGSLLLLLLTTGAAFALKETSVFDRCDGYEFDRRQWKVDQENEAEALAECGTLEGKSRTEVTAMLGKGSLSDPGETGGRRISYVVGWANDYMGPGDAQILYVNLGPDEIVSGASLAYP